MTIVKTIEISSQTVDKVDEKHNFIYFFYALNA